MKLDLLAIAAHPDDAELTCGGTLIKMSRKGYRVGVLDLTRGEMGTRGTPETRLREAARAAKIMRLAHRENLGLPDAHLENSMPFKLAIAHKIRQLNPHTVILPYWEGRHPDHYVAAQIGYEGCFLAGLQNIELEGKAARPFKILYSVVYSDARPTFAVDITAEFAQRRRAIIAYRSQFLPKAKSKSRVHLPLDNLEAEMNLMAGHFGRMIGVKYAEAFIQKEVMRADDVVNLPVRSL
jgi:bacillithiol biosynthesis deacetylase BshB1